MTRRYNKPVGNDPLSIPKVALRFLIGFCVGELEREEKYLPGHPRPFKHKKPTENIMVEPICPCESAADFASKVWLSVPKLQRLANKLTKNQLNHVAMQLTSRPRFACSSSS